ncbi:MAG: hypothetical protein HY824_00810 [Acidobacteria bacterium]|nr:hypothetical protein [Acidobacteriota bacterium]
MQTRTVTAPAVLLVTLVGLCAADLAAQAPSGTKSFDATSTSTDAAIKAAAEAARAAAAARANWTPPRTPWGDPDMRGYWLSLSYTPLERPAALAGKPFYTEQEALAAFKKAVEEDAEVDPRTVHYDWKEYGMDAWQSPVRPSLRTALVVDPADGRIPALTPEGRTRAAAAGRGIDVRSRGLYERCVTGNQGPPRIPGNHDAESQIIQSPGYVVLLMQSNSDVRIIPVDGRPHAPSSVKSWLGDSRGRWEGTTLVIDTMNFHPDREWRGSAGNMHLVERLTLVDAKTIEYTFTVSDPSTWTKPWTAEVPWPRIEPGLFEFACHEQNYGLINVVKGAQIRAREAAEGRASGARETPERDR